VSTKINFLPESVPRYAHPPQKGQIEDADAFVVQASEVYSVSLRDPVISIPPYRISRLYFS
jgi:hypothetical protein